MGSDDICGSKKYELTYQQNMVGEMLIEGIKKAESANDSLEAKATKLMTASTGAIAAVAGFGVLPKQIVELSNPEVVVIVLLCGTALLMVWLYGKLAGARPTSVIGCTDVNKLFDKYIAMEPEMAFNQWMINLSESLKHSVWVNEVKGKKLREMYYVLQSQIVILVMGVLFKALC
jgi:hypothetical protein